MKVVSNTAPLILLSKIKRLSLLDRLYTKVLIPESVLEEFSVKPGEEADSLHSLLQKEKFQSTPVSPQYLQKITSNLGAGERATIALGLEANADLAIIDELHGREIARNHELSITGTIGILIEAHERGVISSVRQELDRLIEAGMWIDESFYHKILTEINEK